MASAAGFGSGQRDRPLSISISESLSAARQKGRDASEAGNAGRGRRDEMEREVRWKIERI